MYILDAYVSEDLALFLGKTLNLIHIAAPILLIVFVTIDLIKAILSQDNEIVSKTVRSIKNRCESFSQFTGIKHFTHVNNVRCIYL